MTPVALGLSLDHAKPRRYFGSRASERPRRALSDRIMQLRRSHGVLHRQNWRRAVMHKQTGFMHKPVETDPSTPQEAA